MKNLRFGFAGTTFSQQTVAMGNYPCFPLTGGMQHTYSDSEVNIQTLYVRADVYIMVTFIQNL